MNDQSARINIVVIDRHALFRHGLIGLLRDSARGWQCSEADIGALGQISEPDTQRVVVVDLELPELGGLPGLTALCAAHAGTCFIALSDYDTPEAILAALRAGAHGYILRGAPPNQFLQAIDTVAAGGVFAPATLAGAPCAPQSRPGIAPPSSEILALVPPAALHLTDRQREVFRLLAEGCPTKTIARRMDLAVGTVKVHLAAIYRSLGASSRLEAVAKAHRHYAIG